MSQNKKTMKRLLFTIGWLMLSPDAANAAQSLPAAPPLTSEKLTGLIADQKAAVEKMDAEKDFDKKLELNMELFKIGEAIKTEKAAIQKANVAAAVKEAQDKKLAFVINFEAAVLADAKVQAGKGTADEKTASSDALTAQRTELQNIVLGTTKIATVAKVSNSAAGTKGAKGAEIIALHTANLAAGMTPTESKKAIVDGGHSRGTTGAVVLAWEKEQGAK